MKNLVEKVGCFKMVKTDPHYRALLLVLILFISKVSIDGKWSFRGRSRGSSGSRSFFSGFKKSPSKHSSYSQHQPAVVGPPKTNYRPPQSYVPKRPAPPTYRSSVSAPKSISNSPSNSHLQGPNQPVRSSFSANSPHIPPGATYYPAGKMPPGAHYYPSGTVPGGAHLQGPPNHPIRSSFSANQPQAGSSHLPPGATYHPAGQLPPGAHYYPAGNMPHPIAHAPAGMPPGATYYPAGQIPPGAHYYPSGSMPVPPPPMQYAAPPAAFLPAGAALPPGAVFMAQPPKSSSLLGFGSGIAAGALGGIVLDRLLIPGIKSHFQSSHNYNPLPPLPAAQAHDDKIIIINNGPPGSVSTTNTDNGATVINTQQQQSQASQTAPLYAHQQPILDYQPPPLAPTYQQPSYQYVQSAQVVSNNQHSQSTSYQHTRPLQTVDTIQTSNSASAATSLAVTTLKPLTGKSSPPPVGFICMTVQVPKADPNDATKTVNVDEIACYPTNQSDQQETNTHPSIAKTVTDANSPPTVAQAQTNSLNITTLVVSQSKDKLETNNSSIAPPANMATNIIVPPTLNIANITSQNITTNQTLSQMGSLICMPTNVLQPDPRDTKKSIVVQQTVCYSNVPVAATAIAPTS